MKLKSLGLAQSCAVRVTALPSAAGGRADMPHVLQYIRAFGDGFALLHGVRPLGAARHGRLQVRQEHHAGQAHHHIPGTDPPNDGASLGAWPRSGGGLLALACLQLRKPYITNSFRAHRYTTVGAHARIRFLCAASRQNCASSWSNHLILLVSPAPESDRQ